MSLNLIPLEEWGVFTGPAPHVIAGPCSAESSSQLLETAQAVRNAGVDVFRAGIWKPRTHPGCFEGIGSTALDWLEEAEDISGVKACCEVASTKHVEECAKHGISIVWIGARTTANPFLVQELAESLENTGMTVLVKNPVNPDLDLWIGAFERLNNKGVRKLGAIHRGVSTFQKIQYRNDPAWEIAIGLRARIPQLPIFCDPSHMSGDRKYIRELSQRALDLGFEGLMIETHPRPCEALSDAAQQITPEELYNLLRGDGALHARRKDSSDSRYRDNIEQLRAKIDVVDENLLSLLARRMELSRQIGEFKKENDIAIMQTERWDEIMERMVKQGGMYSLDAAFIHAVFAQIHKESIAVQNKVLEDENR